MINAESMIQKGKESIIEYLATAKELFVGLDDISIVWFSKTLQNWKLLAITNLFDGRYYEVTYNGDRQEIYLDVYSKEDKRTYSTSKF